MRRHHVVLLTSGFTTAGGCSTHAQHLAYGLSVRGNDVTVIARNATARRLRRLRAGRVRVIEIPGFERSALGALLYLLMGSATAVLRGRRSAFLAVQLSSPSSVGAVASTVRRGPFIALSTSTGPLGEVAEATLGWRRLLRGPVLRRATWLVGQTEDASDELRRLRGDGVVTVPTPVARPARPPELDGAPNALYTGRLVRGKGLRALLRSWKLVLDVRPDARLTLAGTGIPGDPTEDEIRALLAADPRVAAAVDLPGWVGEVAPLLARHDLFVLLSEAEGMSNALLEAAAYGRVCVVSDIPANRAVLGAEHRLFAPPDDEQEIAEVILRAIGDPATRRDARERSGAAAARSEAGEVCRTFAALLGTR